MTQVQNSKKAGLTVKEVAAAVEANTPRVFNMVAALKAASEAPLGRSRASGNSGRAQIVSVVREMLGQAGTPLTMKQIQTGYFAGTGKTSDKKAAKEVYEAVYQNSDACNNKNVDKSKAIFTRDCNGAYSLKA